MRSNSALNKCFSTAEPTLNPSRRFGFRCVSTHLRISAKYEDTERPWTGLLCHVICPCFVPVWNVCFLSVTCFENNHFYLIPIFYLSFTPFIRSYNFAKMLLISSINWNAKYRHEIIFFKAVPLHAMEALGGRGGIAPTHSRPRH
jgi:hypothetical protein